MIFATLKEYNEVLEKVENRQRFEDLTERQNDSLDGMYWSIEAVENLKCEYNMLESDTILEKIQKEIAIEVIDDCIKYITISALEMVAAFRDNNYTE